MIMMSDTTVCLSLGDTEYELDVDYTVGEGECEVEPTGFVHYSTESGWEVTTLGNFILDYAAARVLPIDQAWRCLHDQLAELVMNKLQADYESRWDYGEV